MAKDDEWDFGFSFVDEDELRVMERKLEQQNQVIQEEALTYQQKYDRLYKMVMILLKNLLQEPTKNYIFWPNRTKDVEEFIKKINTL